MQLVSSTMRPHGREFYNSQTSRSSPPPSYQADSRERCSYSMKSLRSAISRSSVNTTRGRNPSNSSELTRANGKATNTSIDSQSAEFSVKKIQGWSISSLLTEGDILVADRAAWGNGRKYEIELEYPDHFELA
ncbi:hypothetical protein RRG08_026674 [Elysia crispata]|uniref:Uncharacterized protein n=1 Tax=Elysia crispata TaxID=231223 RepID=A0AAE1AYJ0_9GAST|nr:hypothetical protein RRG08_026674 [Elysia crispata]